LRNLGPPLRAACIVGLALQLSACTGHPSGGSISVGVYSYAGDPWWPYRGWGDPWPNRGWRGRPPPWWWNRPVFSPRGPGRVVAGRPGVGPGGRRR